MADSQILPITKKSKPYNADDDDEFNSNNYFDELPQETVIDIISRLPISSVIQFTFTCRTLNPLSHDPHFKKRHLSRSGRSSSYLILHSKLSLGHRLHFLQLSDQKVREFHLPFAKSMPKFSIIGPSHGLLCLINSQFPESIYILNPFTKDYFELPKHLDNPYQVIVYGFGFDLVAHNYKVVKIASHCIMYKKFNGRVFNSSQRSKVAVYSKCSNAWIKEGYIPYRIEMWSSSGVLVSRRLHWVSLWGKHEGYDCPQCLIVSFDLADDGFRAIKGPCYHSITEANSRYLSYHLSVLDGCLSASLPVASGHGSFNIWVMKEYGVEESWTKKYSIGVYSPALKVRYQLEDGPRVWRNLFRKKNVKVVCSLEGGEVVLEYRGGGFVAYDPCKESFKKLEYKGMPRGSHKAANVGSFVPVSFYHTVVHVGNFLPANLGG